MILYKHNNNALEVRAVSGGKMSKKKKTMLVAAIVLGIAVLGLAAGVYAKYIASITGQGTATVAKWAFEEENKNKAGLLTCSLAKTYDPDTLVNGKIAPGTEGKCDFKISNTQSEVGVRYTIVAAASNKPTNLKFYSDSAYRTELTAAGITGDLDAGGAETTSTIYWKWEYETKTGDVVTGDEADTANGKAASTMTMDFQISGVQIQPREQ